MVYPAATTPVMIFEGPGRRRKIEHDPAPTAQQLTQIQSPKLLKAQSVVEVSPNSKESTPIEYNRFAKQLVTTRTLIGENGQKQKLKITWNFASLDQNGRAQRDLVKVEVGLDFNRPRTEAQIRGDHRTEQGILAKAQSNPASQKGANWQVQKRLEDITEGRNFSNPLQVPVKNLPEVLKASLVKSLSENNPANVSSDIRKSVDAQAKAFKEALSA